MILPISLLDRTVFRYSYTFYLFRYSHGFYLFPIFAPIQPFSGTHSDCLLVLSRILHIPGTRTDSKVFRYSQRFYLFRYSPDSFSVLSRILPIPCTRADSTIFRYSPGQFLGTLSDSTYSRHSHGFYSFPLIT